MYTKLSNVTQILAERGNVKVRNKVVNETVKDDESIFIYGFDFKF